MPKINHNCSGMALVYTMLATLILSISAALILSQLSASIKSESISREVEFGKDFSDLCERAVIESITSGIPLPKKGSGLEESLNISLSNWPTSGFFSLNKYKMNSNSNCLFRPISITDGFVDQEQLRNNNTDYYKVDSIKDNGFVRVHYETIIGISK
tara:strand:+ start:377 stop:847 length:471 start_codon:yes stop_codon:yes gene_type:complete